MSCEQSLDELSAQCESGWTRPVAAIESCRLREARWRKLVARVMITELVPRQVTSDAQRAFPGHAEREHRKKMTLALNAESLAIR